MFGLSWSEILIIGIVALVFIGPNDLPRAMKTAAKWMSAGRKLAREFQGHVDELVREAELDELREQARQLTMGSISSKIEAYVDPNQELRNALNVPEELLKNPLEEDPSAPTPVQAALTANERAANEAAEAAATSEGFTHPDPDHPSNAGVQAEPPASAHPDIPKPAQ